MKKEGNSFFFFFLPHLINKISLIFLQEVVLNICTAMILKSESNLLHRVKCVLWKGSKINQQATECLKVIKFSFFQHPGLSANLLDTGKALLSMPMH